MKQLHDMQSSNPANMRKSLFILLVLFLSGGCSIWNAALDPDYESSRAGRLCHPYGECSQGTWVADDGMVQDSNIAERECYETVDRGEKDEWWTDSVARGLEIGRCMEKKGFTLQQ